MSVEEQTEARRAAGNECGSCCNGMKVALGRITQVLEKMAEENKHTRIVLRDLTNCFKTAPAPLIHMSMDVPRGNLSIVDSMQDSIISNDSGISSFESSSKSEDEAETQPGSDESNIALSKLADVESKENPNSSNRQGQEINFQNVMEHEMYKYSLEIPVTQEETVIEEGRWTMYDAEKGVGHATVSPKNAFSNMFGSNSSTNQKFYSMPEIGGNNVITLYPGGGGDAQGAYESRQLDSGLNYGHLPLHAREQNTHVIPYPMNRLASVGSSEFFMCQYCSKKFSHHQSLMLHMEGCSSRKEKSVAVLNESEENNCMSVEDRQEITTQSQGSKRRLSRIIQCRFCQRTFPTRHQVMSHERVHTGARPYTCYVCNVTFAHGGNMTKHIKNKHPYHNPYRCGHCEKTFKTYKDFQLHRKGTDCSSRGRIYMNKPKELLSPVGITKIPKSRRSKDVISVRVASTQNVRYVDEDTDSSPENDDPNISNMPMPFEILPPTKTQQSSNFSSPKFKPECLTESISATNNSLPPFIPRSQPKFKQNPKPSVMEQDTNLLLEYSNYSNINLETEPPSDVDSASTVNFGCNPAWNSVESENGRSPKKIKMDVPD